MNRRKVLSLQSGQQVKMKQSGRVLTVKKVIPERLEGMQGGQYPMVETHELGHVTYLALEEYKPASKEKLTTFEKNFPTLAKQAKRFKEERMREIAPKESLHRAFSQSKEKDDDPDKGTVTLNPQELECVMDAFGKYVRGYDQMVEDPSGDAGADEMIEGWDELKRGIGQQKALEVFWTWARTLPEYKTGMCDPDGN